MRRRRVLRSAAVSVWRPLGADAASRAQAALPLQLLRTGDIGGPLGGAAARRARHALAGRQRASIAIAPALAQELKLERCADLRGRAGGVQRLPPSPCRCCPCHRTPARAGPRHSTGESDAGPAARYARLADRRAPAARGRHALRLRARRAVVAAACRGARRALGAAAAALGCGPAVLSLALGGRRAELDSCSFTGNAGALVLFAQRARTLLEATAAHRLPPRCASWAAACARCARASNA